MKPAESRQQASNRNSGSLSPDNRQNIPELVIDICVFGWIGLVTGQLAFCFIGSIRFRLFVGLAYTI
jgi:hypothetical protein